MPGLLNLKDAKRIYHNNQEISRLYLNNQEWIKPKRLSDFYGIGPGRVSIHLSSNSVEYDSNENVTRLINLGGAGSHFDAPVVGNAIFLNSDQTLAMSPTAGTPKLNSAADIYNVRLMFVIGFDGLVNNDRLFGGVNSSGSRFEIQHLISSDGRRRIRLWSNVTGSGSATNPGWQAMPESGLHLVEIQSDVNFVRYWVDGVEMNSASQIWLDTPFLLEHIGAPWNGIGGVTAPIGDVLGVTLGADADQAILTARKHLSDKFNLGL